MERIQMVSSRLAVALTVFSVSFAGRSTMSQKNGTTEFSGVARRGLASIRAAAQYSDFREQVWFLSNIVGPRFNARHRQRRLSTNSPNKCATSSPRCGSNRLPSGAECGETRRPDSVCRSGQMARKCTRDELDRSVKTSSAGCANGKIRQDCSRNMALT